MKYLVIVAHPDDEVLGAGATIHKLINEGTPVTIMEGEEGRLDHQNYGDDERNAQ